MTTIKNPVSLDNQDTSLLATKDRLFAMLAQARGEHGVFDKIVFCEQADKVMFVLDVTQGMFQELGYAYKAQEIAKSIADQCSVFLGHCAHAQTIKRVDETRGRALVLVQRFYALQQARMREQAHLSRIMAMSDMELAS